MNMMADPRVTASRKTQKEAWGGVELLDRQSVLVAEDGTKDDLNPGLTAILRAAIGPENPAALRSFLNELLPEIGIASMEELGGEQLADILQGTLE